jgi:hypothetical protein
LRVFLCDSVFFKPKDTSKPSATGSEERCT